MPVYQPPKRTPNDIWACICTNHCRDKDISACKDYAAGLRNANLLVYMLWGTPGTETLIFRSSAKSQNVNLLQSCSWGAEGAPWWREAPPAAEGGVGRVGGGGGGRGGVR